MNILNDKIKLKVVASLEDVSNLSTRWGAHVEVLGELRAEVQYILVHVGCTDSHVLSCYRCIN